MPNAAELLAVYDAQLRAHLPDRPPHGVNVARDGPVLRISSPRDRGLVIYRSLGGFEGADLDKLIARQVHAFGERGQRFEWKLHGHDRPADLPHRLHAAGFVGEAQETVMIAATPEIAAPLQLPLSVALRSARPARS